VGLNRDHVGMVAVMIRYRAEFHVPCKSGFALVSERVDTDRGPDFALEVAVARHTDRVRYMARPLTTLDIDSAVVRRVTTETPA
jgi:hypothetical protein